MLGFLAAAAAAVVLCWFKISDHDVFWHLKTGELILADGRLPHTNTFSSVFPDHPWPNPSWLLQVALAAVYDAGGWAAVGAATAAAAVLLAAVLYRTLLAAAPRPLLAAAVTVFALSVIRFRLTPRPHLFSYLCFAVTLAILQRRRQGETRLVWVLPPLFALWSNVHPELMMGLLALAIAAAAQVWQRWKQGRRGLGDLGAAALLCLPATLLNPEGVGVLLFPFQHLFLGPVIEVGEYGWSSPAQIPFFWVFVVAALALAALGRGGRDGEEIVTIAAFGLFGALYLRATPYAVLAAAPALHRRVASLAAGSGGLLRARAPQAAALIAAGASLLWAFRFDALVAYRRGWGVNEDVFPVAAANLLATRSLPPRLYNHYDEGGYLIFRLYPAMGVFQDGRVQAYPREFMRRLHSGHAGTDWGRLFEREQVNTALVRIPEIPPLFPHQGWGVVFWDDEWGIVVRRTPEHADLLRRLEYRAFLPGVDLDRFVRPEDVQRLVAEMRRNQAERLRPSARIANNIGSNLSRLGRDAEAVTALLEAIRLDPAYAIAWANLGVVRHRLGAAGEARAAWRRALDLDPTLELARRGLAAVGPGP